MKITSTGRRILLGLGALRLALALVAIPLAPVLFDDHFLWLVLLRPTKEVFLAGGFLAERGDVALAMVVLAAIPLSIFGVWVFYLLGRAYKREIEAGNDLPPAIAKVMKPEHVQRFEKILDAKGVRLIFLGRLAVMSSAAVAAAAGAAGLAPKRFVLVDLAGGMLSIGYTVAAGFFLGEAYEDAGPWLTAVGIVAFMGFAYILGRAIQRS